MDQADSQEVDELVERSMRIVRRILRGSSEGLGRADDSSPIFDARRALARILEES